MPLFLSIEEKTNIGLARINRIWSTTIKLITQLIIILVCFVLHVAKKEQKLKYNSAFKLTTGNLAMISKPNLVVPNSEPPACPSTGKLLSDMCEIAKRNALIKD